MRPDDYGVLWEHVVLEYLQAHATPAAVHYWRDTGGREVDFVVAHGRDRVDVIECTWNPAHIEGYPRSIGGLDAAAP
ncbi:MAG: DUF4143 domain-containing protein [Spirochaetes bacterium]|nr:DUF4143 domain-containing protein [Spirochaetota bacterium]